MINDTRRCYIYVTLGSNHSPLNSHDRFVPEVKRVIENFRYQDEMTIDLSREEDTDISCEHQQQRCEESR